uniref:UPAR/Ly6 domain-containing protein n=1 Tax=Anabas testudineus TaxID=64144 RepID=A0A3Q1IR94_ANATE
MLVSHESTSLICIIPIRLDVRLLGLCWFLTSILLAADLVFPAPAPHSLSCYYCPLQNKSKSCHNITSHCLPNQHCSSSRGHYGPVHILSAQGCLDGELCGSHEMISYRGVKYNVTHTCCCKDNCNEWANKACHLLYMSVSYSQVRATSFCHSGTSSLR